MSKTIQVILILLLAICSTEAQQATCKALVLEGGGDLGAYEAGVIQGLIQNLPTNETDYDVFSGISVGSIMSAGIAQFNKGDEADMIAWVIDLWQQITADDIYINWPGGLLQGLLFEPGLFDTSPLQEYLTTHITQPIKRMISIGATDTNTGDLIRFNESLSQSDLVTAVLASAAVPAVFPYVNFQGFTFMDGGVAVMQDAIGAILRCLEIVEDPSQIIVDMVFIADYEVAAWPQNGGEKTFDAYNRETKIQSFFKAYQEYTITQALYPDVNYRYIVRPSTTLPDSQFPFFFILSDTITMINQGIADAIACINEGSQCHLSVEKDAYEAVYKMRGTQRKMDYSTNQFVKVDL